MVENVGPCKPMRVWIDGRCFNLWKIKTSSPLNKIEGEITSDESDRKFDESDGKFDESDGKFDDTYRLLPFVTDDEEKLSFRFQLPYQYYLALKQRDVLDTELLSKRTNTTIAVPKLGTDEKMVIKGETKENVLEALQEIHSAVGKIRQRSSPLQFLSIRCMSEDIQGNFEKFKRDILAEKDIKGMEESIFQKSFKLHLTIDVLVLFDEKEKKEAEVALEQYHESIMKPLLHKTGPLRIILSGIECMNNKYENVNVLYAKAKLVNEAEDTNLQKIADDLAHYFYERGLLKTYQKTVKLHCTLINTKYRESRNPKMRWAKRKSFDARKIMEKYKDFEFGQCDFNKICISIMSSISPDGYYKDLSSVNLA